MIPLTTDLSDSLLFSCMVLWSYSSMGMVPPKKPGAKGTNFFTNAVYVKLPW